ncbi:hypothetical protein KM043_000952 [Ampulex compressa]|nr:hypothetical protein KM043_000952 [Ampulex compressa]
MSTIGRDLVLALRLVGVWPDTRHAILYKLYWASTMALFQFFQYRYLVRRFGVSDLSSSMDGLTTSLSYTLLATKLITLWINESVLHDILARMAKDWRNNSAIDSNVRIMRSVAYRSHRSSRIIVWLFSMSVVLYGIGIVLSNGKGAENGKAPSPKELPLKLELPFNAEESPIYQMVVVVVFLHQLGAATMFGTLSALLLTLILHVGGQIDIIRQDLVRLSSKGGKDIGGLIERHREVIGFSRHIEQLFTYIALMQFVSNTVVICCLGFLIVISVGSSDGAAMLLKAALFYLAISTDAFIFCFAGEYLSAKGKTIGDAAYASLWYDLSPRESRTLMLLIMRSQKALTITIGKFMDLSLGRFTTIVKASGSYISVLLAMY